MKSILDDPKGIPVVPLSDDYSKEWCLPSASGREAIKGAFLSSWEGEDGHLLLSRISISGQFFDRSPTSSEILGDYHAELSQVILKKARVVLLLDELDNWLRSPKEISLQLAGGGDQRFDISFGVSPHLISTVGRPAFTLVYAGGSFRQGEWSFVVDQTCVRRLRDELGSFSFLRNEHQ